MNPISQIPVALSYVPFVAVELINANSAGKTSDKLTLVAFVPFAALDTLIVQTTISPTK